VALYESGELSVRNAALESIYGNCRLCPRACGVDRTAGEVGACRSSDRAVMASRCLHFGEEPALVMDAGVGNLFFGNCNLRCVYCQNWAISQAESAPDALLDSPGVARAMIELQEKRCASVGLVSPTHFAPAITAALLHAVPAGFRLPLIYNSNGYDSVEVLRLLEGVTEIYLPDLRYADDEMAKRYSGIRGYVGAARKAIKEMHRQTGSRLDTEEGYVRRGLIIRLLVLPGNISGTIESLRWICDELGTGVTVSLMSQYYPAHLAGRYPPLNRTLHEKEYRKVVNEMEALGFENGWVQGSSSEKAYRPDFRNPLNPFQP
jgi:putative pyruvate formate lyase activating enzyme